MSEHHDYFLLSSLPFGVISLAMFGLSSLEGQRAARLRPVKSLPSISNALELSKFLPVLIAVRGKIGAVKPLQTKLTSSSAVLIEESAEFSALKQNEKGIWISDTRTLKLLKTETPWYITDGHVQLGVESFADASHLDRALVTSRLFKEGVHSSYQKVLDRLSGYKPLGVLTTERSLPVGAVVTVVGELAMSFEGDGGMVIQKPTNSIDGEPFYITNQSFQELYRSIMQNAGIFKVSHSSFLQTSENFLGFGSGAIGLTLLGIHFWKEVRCSLRFRRTRRLAAENRRREEARRGRNGNQRHPPDSRAERQGRCIVCWDKQVDAVFIPCGHLCTCYDCGRGLARCPVCRRQCAVHKVFFA